MRVKYINQAAVKRSIQVFPDKYEKELYRIFKWYAGQIMTYFMAVQGSAGAEERGMFWTNHTFKAVEGFFAKAYATQNVVGLTMANTQDYAERLENDFEGRFAPFPTLVSRFSPMILSDMQRALGELK